MFKTTKHNKTFEMKLIAAPPASGTPPDPATKVHHLHHLLYLIDGHQVAREDYLAALQMAEAM